MTEPSAIIEVNSPNRPGPAPKYADCHGGDENRKIESERADKKQHQQHRAQVGSLHDIAEAIDETAAGSHRAFRAVELSGSQER